MSSARIPFRVVFCSSAEEGHAGSQLENSNPHTKGWQSARFCEYPQEVIVQFDRVCEIRQIQLLSHQSKIASRIELSVGNITDTEQDYTQATWQKLGYLSLDSNERSKYQARELKSVYINSVGVYMRLNIRKCHLNTANYYNQVGIVALNILGTATKVEPWDDLHVNMEMDEKTLSQIRSLEQAKTLAIEAEDYDEAKRLKSAIDGMKQLGTRLAKLDKQKMEAVRREEYDLAKELKAEMDHLRKSALSAGPSPYASQQQQQQQQQHQQQPLYREPSSTRIPASTYDEPQEEEGIYAQQLPPSRGFQQQPPSHHSGYSHGEMPHEEYQSMHSQGGSRHSLFGSNGQPVAAVDPFQYDDEEEEPQAQQRQSYNEDRPLPALNKNGGIDPFGSRAAFDGSPVQEPLPSQRSPSPPRNERPLPTFNEDRPLGVGQANRSNPFGGGGGGGGMTSGELDPDAQQNQEGPNPEALAAKHRKDAEPLIPVFGEYQVKCFFSSQWTLRESALDHINVELRDNNYDLGREALFQAVCTILGIAFKDKVAKVFLAACALLQTLVDHFGDMSPNLLRSVLKNHVALLANGLGNSNARVRSTAGDTLLILAQNPSVGCALVATQLLAPLSKKDRNKSAPLKGRGTLLIRLLRLFGVDGQTGMSTDALLADFAIPVLPHREAALREIAITIITEVQLVVGGKAIANYIKPLRPGLKDSLAKALQDAEAMGPEERKELIEEGSVAGLPQPDRSKKLQPRQQQPSSQPQQQQQQPPPPQQHQQQQKQRQEQPQPPQQQQQYQQQAPAEHHEQMDGGPQEEEEGFCQFCGKEDPSLTSEALDLHYWSQCPMLTSCKQCEQVIEIPSLNDHLFSECEVNEGGYVECERCQEPVPQSVYSDHQAANDCLPAKPASQAQRCPLCHTDIEPGLEGWRKHLLIEFCPKNERTSQPHE